MRLEIEHSDGKYWIAKVINVFSNLLSLKWEGAFLDCWFDIKHNKCYPFGHFKNNNNMTLEPPSNLNLTSETISTIAHNYLSSSNQDISNLKPLKLFSSGGVQALHIFKKGSIIEVAHRLNTEKHWFVQVINNIGGRLLLEWYYRGEKIEEDTKNPIRFWLFYCHPRINYLGYAKKKGNISYEPVYLYDSWVSDIQQFLSKSENEDSILTNYLLERSKEKRPSLIDSDSFKSLELDQAVLAFPSEDFKFIPALIKNKSEENFLVSDMRSNIISCYPNDDNMAILPASWPAANKMSFSESEEAHIFISKLDNSNTPLAQINLIPNDKCKKFKVNHKIEVVHPQDSFKVCLIFFLQIKLK